MIAPTKPQADTSLESDRPIVDPFHGLVKTLPFDRRLFKSASKQEILVRMLVKLKRIYVRTRSFQTLAPSRSLLAPNPSAMTELRDRGLLAYHLNDLAAALRDLEDYLRFTSRRNTVSEEAGDDDESSGNEEHAEIWEHVKAPRRRVASLN